MAASTPHFGGKMLPCLLVLWATTFTTINSQALFGGGCKPQTVVSNLNATQYTGLWYENRKYLVISQLFERCVTATFTDAGNGLIRVENKMVTLFDKDQSIVGQAKFANPSNTEGKLTVSFSSETPFASNPTSVTKGNYWVLDTDYDTYSIIWSCKDLFFFNSQILWILTRERQPSKTLIDSALAKIQARGLSTYKLKITDQNNCN